MIQDLDIVEDHLPLPRLDDHSASLFTQEELQGIVEAATAYQEMADIFVSHPALMSILEESKEMAP